MDEIVTAHEKPVDHQTALLFHDYTRLLEAPPERGQTSTCQTTASDVEVQPTSVIDNDDSGRNGLLSPNQDGQCSGRQTI